MKNNKQLRKITYIDVGEMSLKELYRLLSKNYVPWYKDSMFWILALALSSPYILMFLSNLNKVGE